MMLGEMKNLEITSVLCKNSSRNGQMATRQVNAFNIRTSGSIEYCFENKRFVVNAGEMIFLPFGSSYTHRVLSQEDSKSTIINFIGDSVSAIPTVYSLENFTHNHMLFNNFGDLWNFGNAGDRYSCMSLLYELLSFIYNYENLNYSEKKKFSVIKPAMKYLKKHIFDADLKIDELYKLCGVSHTYFRKIFLSETGFTPKEYVVEKRLSHAKVLIENADMETVKELAFSVGYSDALYFSKAFKKKYGISPGNMNLSRKN